VKGTALVDVVAGRNIVFGSVRAMADDGHSTELIAQDNKYRDKTQSEWCVANNSMSRSSAVSNFKWLFALSDS
jgi:hypothetical protein